MRPKNIFSHAKQHLDYFFANIDPTLLDPIIDLCNKANKIVLAGVGKSAFIAKKIVANLVAMGKQACFLSPLDALHGDIGIVEQADVVLFFSKSGSTKELLKIMPHIKKRQATTVAIVCQSSSLAKKADYSIILPLENELCPFNLLPTTSTQIQLIFGDILAVALASTTTEAIFYTNHPSGSLGNKNLAVENIMFKKELIAIVSKKIPLKDAIVDLVAKNQGCLLIEDSEKLIGIFTDGDLKRALSKYGDSLLQQPMKALMTHNPLTIRGSTNLTTALDIMYKNKITTLPITERSKIVGLIHMHDLVAHGITPSNSSFNKEVLFLA